MTRSIYGQLFSRVLMPTWENQVRRRPTLEYYRRLEALQWASRDELEAVQLTALNALLRHSYAHVPFYRQRMNDAGVHQLRHLDQLRQLPILTRQEATQHARARESTAEPFASVRKTTSGSTGTPLVFGYDQNSEHWRQAVKMRGYAWAGWRQGELVLHYWGAPVKRPPLRQQAWITADRALRRELYVDCGRRGDQEMLETVALIKRRRPTAIVCYTQAGADLARFVVARGLRDWGTIPVICGAERLFPADREVMEQAFGKAVFETYGSREVMLMASETDAHEGLLVQMENLIVELVVRDGEKERPAEPGEAGEVVVTDLHNLGMPFVRYANGDMAVAGPRGRSSCGRAHQRLASVEGRVTETLYDATGGKVSGLVFNVMFASLGHAARQFQVVQHVDRSITLRVVPSDTWREDVQKTAEGHAARYLPGLPFRVEKVGDIPIAPGGKRQVVVVEKPRATV